MFFTPGNRPETLTHDPFNAIVVPRPIGWISTQSTDGIPNLAPYSFFNAVVFDRVVGIHINDQYITNGKLDLTRLQPVGRLGYLDYVRVTELFSMDRPTWP